MPVSEVVTAKDVDLSNCDRELIQYPGAILPHGVLLVLKEPGFEIIQASQNTRELFGIAAEALLNQPLSRLIPGPALDALRARLPVELSQGSPARVAVTTIAGQSFDILAHRIDQVIVVECEPRHEEVWSIPDLYSGLRASIVRLQAATGVQEFLDLAVHQLRAFTGFDRVMGYKFLEDGSGWVRSESVIADEISYLEQHFPASDVPAPARRLFSLSWLRHQPDMSYTPVPLIPENNPITGGPLDMSLAVLRSVSVMYSQYLKNMGTSASMVLTLMKNNKLWGLIACHHHHGPRHVSYDVRVACEFIANMVSLLISEKEDREHADYQAKMKATQQRLVQASTRAENLSEKLAANLPDLLHFVNAEGGAVTNKGTVLTVGVTPTTNQIHGLLDWLAANVTDEIFASDCLSVHYPPAEQFKDSASGLLALRLPAIEKEYFLWFRQEIITTVKWAGDPRKPAELAQGYQRLLPRTSFALWIESVHSKSSPWLDFEVQAAHDLRTALLSVSVRKAEEITQLYQELEQSYVQLEAFTYMASHDLKEPLRGIHNYARLLLEDCTGKLEPEDIGKLQTIARLSQRMEKMMNSLLDYSRMSRDELALQPCDVNAVLVEVLDSLSARIEESGAALRIAPGFPSITADPFTVGEIFANLIVNALKYNEKDEKWVEVGFEEKPQTPTVFFVRDNGIGMEAENLDSIFTIFRRLHRTKDYGGGSGVGLTVARKLAERHGGRMWVSSKPQEGSCFYFTLSAPPRAGQPQ